MVGVLFTQFPGNLHVAVVVRCRYFDSRGIKRDAPHLMPIDWLLNTLPIHPDVVAADLDHAGLDMTMNTYGHVRLEVTHDALDQLGGLFTHKTEGNESSWLWSIVVVRAVLRGGTFCVSAGQRRSQRGDLNP